MRGEVEKGKGENTILRRVPGDSRERRGGEGREEGKRGERRGRRGE